MIGKTVSYCGIIEKLGCGGMGVGDKAGETRLKRPVVLKFLPEALSRDRHTLERFEREAKRLASLIHPNIASIYRLEQTNGKR